MPLHMFRFIFINFLRKEKTQILQRKVNIVIEKVKRKTKRIKEENCHPALITQK